MSGLISSLAKNQGKNVPIALHLDHGKTYQDVVDCVKNGFSSVMIDASNKLFEENISLTKKVVQYAHKHKVWVQAELGQVVRGEQGYKKMLKGPEEFLTDPDQAQEFVKKTKVDTLAVAIGNVHGLYKIKHGTPKLFLSRLKEIRKKVNIPLVLHGASGINSEKIKKAIFLGIRVINIDTEIRIAFRKAIEKSLKDKNLYDPRKILNPGIEAVAEVVNKKIKMFRF